MAAALGACDESDRAARLILQVVGAQQPRSVEEVRQRSGLSWTPDGAASRAQLPYGTRIVARAAVTPELTIESPRVETFDVIASLRAAGATVTAIGCTPNTLPHYMGVYRVTAPNVAPFELWMGITPLGNGQERYGVNANLSGRITTFAELEAQAPGVSQQCR